MKIYTKTGDTGETSLFDKTRVSKADPRVEAYGEVDELNACLGAARAAGVDADIAALIEHLQKGLFAVGARLADPSSRIASRMTLFSVRTLGFPEIRRDDQACPMTLRKGLALLVYLAEAGGPVGRDVIATLLWPDNAEEVVRARLRRLVHRLQLTLGDVFATDRSTIRWSPAIDLEIDAEKAGGDHRQPLTQWPAGPRSGRARSRDPIRLPAA